jgi:hypothetical protein
MLDVTWWQRWFARCPEPVAIEDEDGYGSLPAADDVTEQDGVTGSIGRGTTGRRGGWMSTWRHGRSSAVVLDAGSVWRLRCASEPEAARALQILTDERQIGERRHEGFGWILGWTGNAEAQPAEAEAQTTAGDGADGETDREPTGVAAVESRAPVPQPIDVKGKIQLWPGCEHLGDAELTAIAERLSGHSFRAETARDCRVVLQELRDALRGNVADVSGVRAWCQQKATRKNPGAWRQFRANDDGTELGEHARMFGPLWGKPVEAVRFACEVLLVRADLAGGRES